MIAHAYTFSRSLALLLLVYLAAQTVGLLVYHGGEVYRVWSIRGRIDLPASIFTTR